jgi:hypothetical protein
LKCELISSACNLFETPIEVSRKLGVMGINGIFHCISHYGCCIFLVMEQGYHHKNHGDNALYMFTIYNVFLINSLNIPLMQPEYTVDMYPKFNYNTPSCVSKGYVYDIWLWLILIPNAANRTYEPILGWKQSQKLSKWKDEYVNSRMVVETLSHFTI